MSCSHLLVGLPLPLLPSILASKMCLSSVSWHLMWPKYLSLSVFAFCRSIVVFISNLESTSLLVTFSIQDILKIFLISFHFKICYPFCIRAVYGFEIFINKIIYKWLMISWFYDYDKTDLLSFEILYKQSIKWLMASLRGTPCIPKQH